MTLLSPNWRWRCNHPQKGYQQNCQVLILLKGVPLLWLEEFLIPPSDRKKLFLTSSDPHHDKTTYRMTLTYCWWNSCTGWYGNNPVIFMVLYIPAMSTINCIFYIFWYVMVVRFHKGASSTFSSPPYLNFRFVCSWDPKAFLEEKAAKKNKTPLIRILTTRQLKHPWYNYQQTTPFNGEATKNMKETMTSPELFGLALNGQSFSTLNFLNTHDGSMGLE